MEGKFPTSTYNRKSSIVVKKQYDGFLLRLSSTYNWFNQEKKSSSTYIRTSSYNRNLRVVHCFIKEGISQSSSISNGKKKITFVNIFFAISSSAIIEEITSGL